MVLQTKSSSFQNRMLGQRIQHPSSTNYHEEEGFPNPSAKRLKRFDSTETFLSRGGSEDEEGRVTPIRRVYSWEIPDSETENENENQVSLDPGRQTELESALPSIQTDEEAIAKYEAARAAEGELLVLKGRLGQRKWVQGKSSIYVDAFNQALETVLEDESHLFDEAEKAVFEQWRNLSYEGQYLYVRLFLRKTAAWHRINRLRYYADIANLPNAANELMEVHSVPPAAHISTPSDDSQEPDFPSEVVLGSLYSLADGSDDHISSLDEACPLLMLDELKAIAKEAKLQGKTKGELIKALKRTSQGQGGLGWSKLKRSNSGQRVDLGTFGTEAGEPVETVEESKVNREAYFLGKILAEIGPCIRLSSTVRRLFERVHLVFYRSTDWTEKSLTIIILARISKRNFPQYLVSRSTNIFLSRHALLEFEAAIRTQSQVDEILEMNGTVTKDGLQKVHDIFEKVYPRWKVLLAEEQRKEDRVYESGEGAYLRRFSPAWVYTRIVHKGAYVLGRIKRHAYEYQVLSELLSQNLFHAARRGSWYQRKALLEEHYMSALQPMEERSEMAQKKHWKKVALQTCEDGLQDRNCHLIFHYDLQKRVMKLEKALKVAKRQQHDFGHVLLSKAVERKVEGIRIQKEITPGRNSSRRGSDASSSRRGNKTIWVDEREGGGECGVEAMCLSWYRDQGWKGYHSEGGIVRTLFGYLFHDILFAYVPNIFQTPFQTCPLDLFTDAFYASRASEINHRLAEISNGAAERLVQAVFEREHDQETCIVGLDWSFEIEDLLEVVRCFRGEALATVCKVMAQEYQQRCGGIPDLFLWHPAQGEVMFAEVKSENDRLSDTQRLWIHVLIGAGIRVELCLAVAKEVITSKM